MGKQLNYLSSQWQLSKMVSVKIGDKGAVAFGEQLIE